MGDRRLSVLLIVLAAGALFGQSSQKTVQVKTKLGRTFYSLPDEKGAVAAAEKALAADPKNVQLILKLAQAQALVWQDKEAAETCTRGLKIEPNNAALLLERGHRELPLRQFEKARADLKRAVQLDPKQPEAYYHLGLAHYFLGEFAPAADAFCEGRELVASKQDSLVNFTNWCYASLRRAGKTDLAAKALEAVPTSMKSNEGHTEFYFNLVRFFQGQKAEQEIIPPAPKDANDTEGELAYDTVNYGVGNWHLYNGEPDKAQEYFQRVSKGNVWITWGFIGSELEVGKKGR